MNIALDSNGYSDFMRGDRIRVQIVRTARHIHIPLIVLGELRAGFAVGNQESTNAANLQKFLKSPRVSILLPDEQTTHHYAQLYVHLPCLTPTARSPSSNSAPSEWKELRCSVRHGRRTNRKSNRGR